MNREGKKEETSCSVHQTLFVSPGQYFLLNELRAMWCRARVWSFCFWFCCHLLLLWCFGSARILHTSASLSNCFREGLILQSHKNKQISGVNNGTVVLVGHWLNRKKGGEFPGITNMLKLQVPWYLPHCSWSQSICSHFQIEGSLFFFMGFIPFREKQ
jgi:hypothetical protein